MPHVFVVQHLYEDSEDQEHVRMIGTYTTEDDARAAVERLRLRPGFCDYTDGFSVDRYELNADHWTEGFISWSDACAPPRG